MSNLAAWDAIVLAGGRARRLGGIDKTMLEWDGRPLLAHAIDAVRAAGAMAVVGQPRRHAALDGAPQLEWAAERAPFAGPAAAIAAGRAKLDQRGARGSWTVVVCADIPRVSQAVPALVAAAASTALDAVVAHDSSDRAQPLLAVYRTDRLQAEIRRHGGEAGLANAPARALLDGLRAEPLALGSLCADVDTAADAAAHGIVLPQQALAKSEAIA